MIQRKTLTSQVSVLYENLNLSQSTRLDFNKAWKNTSMPFYYNVFPDSIVDVTTIRNFLKYLDFFDLKQIKLVMESGFCVTANILGMDGLDDNFEFLQPQWFSFQKAKDLFIRHKKN